MWRVSQFGDGEEDVFQLVKQGADVYLRARIKGEAERDARASLDGERPRSWRGVKTSVGGVAVKSLVVEEEEGVALSWIAFQPWWEWVLGP